MGQPARRHAVYDAADIWRALNATSQLFRRIAQATAQRLSYPYPLAADEQVSVWLAALHPK